MGKVKEYYKGGDRGTPVITDSGSRVIAVKSDVHHKLRVFAAVNKTTIAEVTEKAVLGYIKENNG